MGVTVNTGRGHTLMCVCPPPHAARRSISNRNIRSNYNMQLTQQVSPSGFSGIWPSGPRGGQLGPQETQFVPPCLMSHKIVAKGFDSMVVVYAGKSFS